MLLPNPTGLILNSLRSNKMSFNYTWAPKKFTQFRFNDCHQAAIAWLGLMMPAKHTYKARTIADAVISGLQTYF
jgi:hypothetical protein